MDKKTISTMKKMFDDIMHTTDEGTCLLYTSPSPRDPM